MVNADSPVYREQNAAIEPVAEVYIMNAVIILAFVQGQRVMALMVNFVVHQAFIAQLVERRIAVGFLTQSLALPWASAARRRHWCVVHPYPLIQRGIVVQRGNNAAQRVVVDRE